MDGHRIEEISELPREIGGSVDDVLIDERLAGREVQSINEEGLGERETVTAEKRLVLPLLRVWDEGSNAPDLDEREEVRDGLGAFGLDLASENCQRSPADLI